MSRPDASPENDVISLQVISIQDAERLYRSYVHLQMISAERQFYGSDHQRIDVLRPAITHPVLHSQ